MYTYCPVCPNVSWTCIYMYVYMCIYEIAELSAVFFFIFICMLPRVLDSCLSTFCCYKSK